MLPFSWRTNLPKLETLVLSQNFIGPQLTEVDFDFKQTQISINLSNNSINSIILDGFKEQASFAINFYKTVFNLTLQSEHFCAAVRTKWN